MSNYYQRRENGDGTYSENVAVTDSDAVIPIYIEYRKHTQAPSATATVPATSVGAPGPWFKTDGHDTLSAHVVNDANFKTQGCFVHWSFDGVNMVTGEYIVSNAAVPTGAGRADIMSVKAPWARLAPYNGDSVAHVMTTYPFLKA